jgi:hypothetical protein
VLTLGDEHAALMTACRQMAAQLDEFGDPQLWREYRQLLLQLAKAGDGVGDDDTAQFLQLVTKPVPAKVRNRKNA